MRITRGKIESAQKVVIYGPEGIGKSTFAAHFPDPIFIDTEGSTKHMDVARTPAPSSWTMLLQQVNYFKSNPHLLKTLIIDTADWAEQLCTTEICSKYQKKSIADFGYGNGHVYLAEEFGRLLNSLEDIIELGINVVVTAHAQMRKFEQPEEMGAYDRWELKLHKKTAPLLKEWADMVLFANYEIHVVNVDNQGVQKGKNKAQGGKRVMYTTHNPSWDAKNRHDLSAKLDFEYSAIAHCILTTTTVPAKQNKIETPVQEQPKQELVQEVIQQEPLVAKEPPRQESVNPFVEEKIPKALRDLMKSNNVTVDEIKKIVAMRGYYPEDTPVENYDPDFINGVLIGAWGQVFQMITEERVKNGEFVPVKDFMNIPDGIDEDAMPFD